MKCVIHCFSAPVLYTFLILFCFVLFSFVLLCSTCKQRPGLGESGSVAPAHNVLHLNTVQLQGWVRVAQ